MTRREAEGPRVLRDIMQPYRHRLVDQQPEDAAAPRKVADRGVNLGLLPGGQELRQLAPLVVEHAQRGVPRAAQLAGGLQDALEEDVQVELGRERTTHVQELPQAVCALRRLDIA